MPQRGIDLSYGYGSMSIMTEAKTERNKLIVKLIDKGWTYSKVQKEMRFKSKGTVWEIYKRVKHGVRRTHKLKKLSTV